MERRPALLPGGRRRTTTACAATITGTAPVTPSRCGSRAAPSRSASFTYTVHSDSGQPRAAAGSRGLHRSDAGRRRRRAELHRRYQEALAANNVAHDTYDVDAMGRQAPHPLAVLGHYDAVIWFTGDDYLTREPGQVPGTGTSRLALTEVVAVRDYLNEGGQLFLGGKHAGQQSSRATSSATTAIRSPARATRGMVRRAARRGGRRLHRAHERLLPVLHGGLPPRGRRRLVGRCDRRRPPGRGRRRLRARPLDSGRRSRRPDAGAPTSTLASTSSLLFTEAYDDFSEVVAAWDRLEAGPFSPKTGSQYLYSGTADEAYMRLHRTATVPADDRTLKFSASFDTEQFWDFVFVEVRQTVGDVDDAARRERAHDPGHRPVVLGRRGLGDAALADAAYQTKKGDSCTPTGTTGEWNAATGSSGGWQDWRST